MEISIEKIAELTQEYGGEWGIKHTRRLLKIISIISEEIQYNNYAIIISAYLHDWGAYTKWAVPDVEHAVRSRQVAEEFLKANKCEKDLMKLILECIESHHSATNNNSIEAKLLSDADALDFLGVAGVLRDFSKKPKNLRKAYETVEMRRNALPGRLLLDKSREIAEKRVRLMDELLIEFEHETFGIF